MPFINLNLFCFKYYENNLTKPYQLIKSWDSSLPNDLAYITISLRSILSLLPESAIFNRESNTIC